uniref:G-protein coupled receptors family 1 profile domain-containing protein n=1 Tax=Glossina palpalis gambiensis TaxID=67801 RepID=A0A1B0BX38_9MUSC
MLNTMIDNNSSCINSNNNNNNGTNATITIAGTGSEETSDVWRIFEFVSHILNCVYVPIIVCMGSYLASFCSSWFVVAFTVERFIAVMYPLKRQTMCTVRRAKIVLSGISVLGILHCIPFWISSQPVSLDERQTTICDIKNEYKDACNSCVHKYSY